MILILRQTALVLLVSAAGTSAAGRWSTETATDRNGSACVRIETVRSGMTLADILATAPTDDRVDIDPGTVPEGDYLGWMSYTRDGGRLLLTNRVTNNITVFDAVTMAVDTNIPTGTSPGAIAVTDSLCLVTLGFADSIEVYRLADWSRLARLPAGEQPWVIRLSPNDSLAFVGCDLSNTCEIYDLTTLEHIRTITDFPVYLSTATWNSENGRFSFTFSEFEAHPNGDRLLAPNGNDTIYVFEVESGQPVDTLVGFGDCRNLRFSGDRTCAVVVDGGDPLTGHRLRLDSMVVDASVSIPGRSVSMDRSCGVNWDGSKAFVSVSGNQSALLRFETGDYVTFNETYSAFWIGVSPDHSLAISGQYRFSVVDFADERIVGQHLGNAQSVGTVSPVACQAAGIDPHRHEGVYFYSFSDSSAPIFRGSTSSGLDPEADAPRRIALSPDGAKAVVVNVLSDNVAVIDLDSLVLDTILACGDRPQCVGITSDSRWAAVACIGSYRTTVIDLQNGSVATQVDCGSGPWPLVISPDDSFAYVGNLSGNDIGVIRLDGASSELVTRVPVGEIGVVWAGYGVGSGLAVSPNGDYLLVCVSFDDVIKVIDTRTRAVVATLPAGDFPIQAEFNARGDYAVVSNYFDNTYTVLRVQGESSYVVGYFPAGGEKPLRLARNTRADEIGIGVYADRLVQTVDPSSGTIIRTDRFPGYGSLIQPGYDELGQTMALTMSTADAPGHLHRGTDHIELPAVPTAFDYCPSAFRAGVAMPGPDWVSVITWPPSALRKLRDAGADTDSRLRALSTVARGRLVIGLDVSLPTELAVSVFDASGRQVVPTLHQAAPAGRSRIQIGLPQCPSGVYVWRVSGAGQVAAGQVVLSK